MRTRYSIDKFLFSVITVKNKHLKNPVNVVKLRDSFPAEDSRQKIKNYQKTSSNSRKSKTF